MKTKLFILLLISLTQNVNMFAQKEHSEKINELNNKGQKEGLWTDKGTYFIDYMYFVSGKPNGIFYRIKKSTNSLVWFGELINGDYSGTYYMFSDYGHLEIEMNNFQTNTNEVPLEHHVQGIFPNCCYCVNYYPNGNKKSEGVLLFDDSPVINSFEYGEWKYYDENGKLQKNKTFK